MTYKVQCTCRKNDYFMEEHAIIFSEKLEKVLLMRELKLLER